MPHTTPTYHTNFTFHDRVSRAEYIWRKYTPLLQESVLDLGAWQCHLRHHVPATAHYVGVDLDTEHGNPDVVANLDHGQVPFADNSFACVVCTDVLEHLESPHAMLDEMCRVSRAYVILSLPNPVGDFYHALCSGRPITMKYYALSKNQHDRHKWFFSLHDAQQLLEQKAQQHGMQMVQIDFPRMTPEEGYGWRGWLRRQARNYLFRHSPEIPHLYHKEMWVVMKKESPASGA
ncbi:class I SAM-dependent methyltransferase [Magnetococcus marinus]|nr:methyltransferase domain-containing protein [Magnetococcus marinus]